jgi:hypothetical protein
VDHVDQAAADHVLDRVVAGLGGKPAQRQREVQRARTIIDFGGPPDREVGVGSTGSSTAGVGVGCAQQHQGGDEGDFTRRHASTIHESMICESR